MENYIGKICPFCKTEIKEGDSVKVCSACGIPHHEKCWEENNGCTTLGCSEQHYEAQNTNPMDVCKKCGTPLGEGQAFCPKCGQKAGLSVDASVSPAINQFNAGVDKANETTKKKPIAIIAAAAIAVVVIILAALVVPKLLVSVEDLCAQGKYEKAYSKASGDEKLIVLAENTIAFLSEESSDKLKDPSSFVLREGYYDCQYQDEELTQQAVLHVSGANSYGALVSSYWIYTYDDDTDSWSIVGTCSSLNVDSDDDEFFDSVIAKMIIERDSVIKLSKEQVKNINTMFENDVLDQVEQLDPDTLDTSIMQERIDS